MKACFVTTNIKGHLYSALFIVHCGALPHVQLKLEYDKTPQRTVTNAEYKHTFSFQVHY